MRFGKTSATGYFTALTTGAFGLAGPAAGLKYFTRKPPSAASRMPRKNGAGTFAQPPGGGCRIKETIAFTIGAPAKIIDMTTPGFPPAPNASNTPNAPIAPTMPAISDHVIPLELYALHAAPFIISNASGASTALRK